jgi:nucleoside 2-deoxyribosyltransferase
MLGLKWLGRGLKKVGNWIVPDENIQQPQPQPGQAGWNRIPKDGHVLEGVRCYLSGPIEHDATHTNWRTDPTKQLVEGFKINLFDPYSDPKQQWVPLLHEARANKDYNEIARIAADFVHKDLAIVDRCDFVIAYLPKGVPTTGTHHEIINSVNAKKPTLLVCPQGKENVPIWYYGFIPHEVMFGSWEELYTYLHEVNDGKHKDKRRWAFVYGLV